MVPVSASASGPGPSLLRERLALLKALDFCLWSRSKCFSCAKRDLPSYAISDEVAVGSCAGPGTRTSLQRERLAGTIASPRLGINHSLWYEHHDRDCDYNGRSTHVDSPWG